MRIKAVLLPYGDQQLAATNQPNKAFYIGLPPSASLAGGRQITRSGGINKALILPLRQPSI
jgi:hypothetical protein